MTIVHREITRLNVLIGDLLDYANPRPPQAVDFDLGILIEETLQVARGDQAFAEVDVSAEVAKRWRSTPTRRSCARCCGTSSATPPMPRRRRQARDHHRA